MKTLELLVLYLQRKGIASCQYLDGGLNHPGCLLCDPSEEAGTMLDRSTRQPGLDSKYIYKLPGQLRKGDLFRKIINHYGEREDGIWRSHWSLGIPLSMIEICPGLYKGNKMMIMVSPRTGISYYDYFKRDQPVAVRRKH